MSLCLQRFKFAEIFTHDQPQPFCSRSSPIALEFAGKSQNRDWNGARLNHALHRGFMRHTADTPDCIDDDIHLITRAQCVKGGKTTQTSVHKPAMMSLFRPVRSTAETNSGSSHEFMLVRSNSGTPGKASRSSTFVPAMPCLT